MDPDFTPTQVGQDPNQSNNPVVSTPDQPQPQPSQPATLPEPPQPTPTPETDIIPAPQDELIETISPTALFTSEPMPASAPPVVESIPFSAPVAPQPASETISPAPAPVHPAVPAKSSGAKTLLIALALILVGILLGVLASSFVPTLIPATPPTPAPTPTVSTTPSNLQMLNSPIYSFVAQVPDTWTRVETSSNFPYLFQFRTSDDSTFEVLVRDLPSGQTLDQYLAEQDEIAQTAFEGQPSKKVISSQPITVNKVEGIEREEEFLAAGLTGRVIYVVSANNVYSLSFIPGPANNVLESQVYKSKQTIIDGFTLTTPEAGTGYTCPPGEWIDCMPGQGPQSSQCTPAFLDWAKANCPGFQGAAL